MQRFLLVLSALFLAACGGSDAPPPAEPETESESVEHEHADGHEGHNHGHHDANKHMHQSSFEELLARFNDPARDEWQQPNKVIELLGDLSGKTVADIGAGGGYFTFPMAEVAEKVIALDIDTNFLQYINEQCAKHARENVEVRHTPEHSPRLTPGEADAAIIVNTYHHIQNREAYFGQVAAGLKKGGKLLVVDFKAEETPMGPPVDMRIDPEVVIKELEAAGFVLQGIDRNLLPYQYVILVATGVADFTAPIE